MFHIKSTTTLTDNDVRDLLCCALEGGSNYWYVIEKVFCTHRDMAELVGGKIKDPDVYDAIVDGQGVLIGLVEEDETVHGEKQWVLNREAITRGLQSLANNRPELFAKIAIEDYDANDADVFLQYALFGELVFG